MIHRVVGGPQSQIEAEAKKKLISEKEIKLAIEFETNSKELRHIKTRIRELLDFYDRIIRSIDITVKNINSSSQLSMKYKNDKYLTQHEKDLSQAKVEKSKFRRYLKQIELKIETLSQQSNPKGLGL